MDVFLINISSFDCMLEPNDSVYTSYDIRTMNNKMKAKSNFKRRVWTMLK